MPWHLKVFDPKGYENTYTGSDWRTVGRGVVEPVEAVRPHSIQTEMQYEQIDNQRQQVGVQQQEKEPKDEEKKPKEQEAKPPPPAKSSAEKAKPQAPIEKEITLEQEFYGPGELTGIAQDFLDSRFSTVQESDSVDIAKKKLQEVPYLVVLNDQKKICGVLTLRNLQNKGKTVRECMTSPIICSFLDTPIETIVEIMVGEKIGFFPVIDSEGKLQGIVSKRSILEYIYNSSRFFAATKQESSEESRK